MKNQFSFVNDFDSKLLIKNKFETIEYSIYLILAIITPFVLNQPHIINQLILGSIINFILASTALYYSIKKIIPLIIIPSVSVFLTGIIFGAQTSYLLYFIPFIWISNTIYVYLIKKIRVVGGKNFAIAVSIASVSKSFFLLIITIIFISINLVPSVFLIAMGFTQLITALIGGSLTGIINHFRK